jgi:acetolactate synthase I/II/III large subunit
MVRLADYVIDKIYQFNVKHIFMVTGRGALFLTDAVAAHKDVKGISVHHEQSAAYAAVAYAQYNGEMGACLVSTGCASTNAITGVLNAWQDGIPCIFISGQNKLKETTNYTKLPIRTYGQQEADVIPLIKSITKYSVMITDANKIAYELEKAIYLANEGKKGPVWIDIPLDVQNMRIDLNKIEHFLPENSISYSPKVEDVEYVRNELQKATRPILLIGSGISSGKAIKELNDFLELNPMPLVYSSSATDIYGLENELSIGSVGIMGCSRAGNFAVQNADLVLILASRANSMTIGESCQFARAAKKIVIDIDAIEHTKNSLNIDKLIISDIKEFLQGLLVRKISIKYDFWIEKCKHWKKIFPKCEEKYKNEERVDLYYLSDALSKVLPKVSSVITDSGLIELILPTNMTFSNTQKCIHPVSQGSMGFSIPAILGVHYASNSPVITVVGDGSVMMNIQELQSISYHKIPAKIFIINNNAYAVIRKRQKQMFRGRTIGTDFTDGINCPNFEDIAKTFNFKFEKIESSENLEEKLQDIINMEGAVICEILGLEDQEYISSGHAKDKNGQIVTRPIEDQTPYLDRELFLAEMMIEPINQ